jgi:peptidoglycan/xylan/chitin deacetylase (PgdA/CDA1 family)
MQIECIQRKWDFISPEVFHTGITSSKILLGRQVLLTFDDGFESNYRVAQEILNPLGIKAIFFVIPEFVNTVGVENQWQFIETRLYPGQAARAIPSGLRSMTWDQIRELSNQGHVIGCLTRTHARLSELHKEKLLVEEIVASGDEIEQRLGVKVEDFAFTFGTLTP